MPSHCLRLFVDGRRHISGINKFRDRQIMEKTDRICFRLIYRMRQKSWSLPQSFSALFCHFNQNASASHRPYHQVSRSFLDPRSSGS